MKLALLAGSLALAATCARADPLDDAFASFAKPGSPGCAVGVARKGEAPILRAYGQAELEHRVPITPETIFEAGSVSKQFTAAAVLTLVADGKLALSDDIRKHLPEMPSYGAPITIDHLLAHTSGLRDWGEVAAIAGWPRGDIAYTNEEALKIAARQRALNYPTGEDWSYTNTGYNLLAVIVQRVSGKSLAEFSRERLFQPLGMTHTSWRDDFRRVVPGRATAYGPGAGGWRQAMPFENVYRNGGLLTTVGDLLIWNEALASGKLGPQVTAQLQEQAVLKGGRKVAYARGLFVQTYRGEKEVSHSGATGGYRAWLARYPGRGLSVAVLCNAASMGEQQSQKVADAFLPAAAPATPRPAGEPAATPPAELTGRPGLYIAEGPLNIVRLAAEGDHLRIQGGPSLEPVDGGGYRAGTSRLTFRANGDLERRSSDGAVSVYRRMTAGAPTPAELAEIAGTYVSDDAQATMVVRVKDGRLVVGPAERPSAATTLSPLFRDGFAQLGALIRVLRDGKGKVTGLRYSGGRVWDLRLRKVS